MDNLYPNSFKIYQDRVNYLNPLRIVLDFILIKSNLTIQDNIDLGLSFLNRTRILLDRNTSIIIHEIKIKSNQSRFIQILILFRIDIQNISNITFFLIETPLVAEG